MADLIVTAGAHRVLSMDLHAGQIQGFFNIPFDHLFSAPVMISRQKSVQGDIVIVSPDAGGVKELARMPSIWMLRLPLSIKDVRKPMFQK
ncbi:MAG: hypothetical protein R3A45_06900 [Bdellovibrionota bacterium]